MDISFFELKYMITDQFYRESICTSYSFTQAGGRCWEAFTEYVISDGIEAIVAISTIISLKIINKEPLIEYDIEGIDKIWGLMKKIPVEILLEKKECKYLKEDIKIIKHKYMRDDVSTIGEGCGEFSDKNIDMNFFELKFLITNTFYTNISINKYSFEDAVNICYEEFVRAVKPDSIEAIIAMVTIIRLQIRYDIKISEFYIKIMKKLIDIKKVMPFDRLLDENQYEYFEEDIRIINIVYNEAIGEK